MDNLNIGVQKAQEATINNGLESFILPESINGNKTDFNDVMKSQGVKEVKRQIEEGSIEIRPIAIRSDNLSKVKKFDVDLLLPEELREFVTSEARTKPVAPEMVAIPLIVGLSSLLAGKVYIKPKEKSDFTITPNLWGFIIAEPSSKKSSAIKSGTFFFSELEEKAQEQYDSEISEYNKTFNEHRIAKKVCEVDLEKSFRSKTIGAIEIAKKKLADLEEPKKVFLERYRIKDSTTQKITEILIYRVTRLAGDLFLLRMLRYQL